ncbi:hypothetical protein Poly51_46310 [Rubripirellula tenax]|uniref:Uncharacterized protein n=1 Tax=Rubripirellula tenax TaxID=2528015 RepID=A0A5C6EN29_9BACT|nr:hypothetical protein Poly51_46310 [Rubripirellula tenax]
MVQNLKIVVGRHSGKSWCWSCMNAETPHLGMKTQNKLSRFGD